MTAEAPHAGPGTTPVSDSSPVPSPVGSAHTTSEPSVEAAGSYAVKLEVFEGPLDLLLHLIRINEVEITDIPISLVAEQYLEYLDVMHELNLEIAGEYLLMAATLAWIKSRMLLPPDPSSITEEGGDPRAELVARLLEYQRFKEAAAGLGERQLLGRDVYEAHSPPLEGVPEGEREIEVGLFELVSAFREALRHAGPSGAAHEVEVETITVHERMIVVMKALGVREACEFEELIRENGEWASRGIIVATFLAILELTRLEALGIYQGVDDRNVPNGPIHLRRRGEAGDGSWIERISELM